jgi:hypothetical protein
MRTAKKNYPGRLFFSLPFFCFSWGVLGHRIVGQIAESYLTPKARIGIQKILGNESIAMVSNWADFIKSDSAYQYIYNWHFIDIDSGLTKTKFAHLPSKRYSHGSVYKNKFS